MNDSWNWVNWSNIWFVFLFWFFEGSRAEKKVARRNVPVLYTRARPLLAGHKLMTKKGIDPKITKNKPRRANALLAFYSA
jgi:hypothetical protein